MSHQSGCQNKTLWLVIILLLLSGSALASLPWPGPRPAQAAGWSHVTYQAINSGQALRQKETGRSKLMLPQIKAARRLLGRHGILQAPQDDYLYLVETGLSDTRLNPFIRRDLQYEVLIGPGGRPVLSTLTINESNTYMPGVVAPESSAGDDAGSRSAPVTGQMDGGPGYYASHLRLFLPVGSQLLGAAGLDQGPDLGSENDRPFIGGYFSLPPGEQRQMQFKWIPTGNVGTSNRYQLMVQHQPETPPSPLTVTVRLVTDYYIAAATPPATTVTGDAVTWNTTLDQDQTFSLVFEGEGKELISMPMTLITPVTLVLSTTLPISTTSPGAMVSVPSGRPPLPVWLIIPDIGVNAPIVPVGLEPSGIMASPRQADIVGWYQYGARPGEASNAVLAGHVDWLGQVGAFAHLQELEPGDLIEVQSGPETWYRYTVETMQSYQADAAPVAEIFGETSEPVLTLITCGGPYDPVRQKYRDRLIIRARGE